jgi:hypothetical protein
MGNRKLSDTLVEKIRTLRTQGFSINMILDTIQEEATSYVDSKSQLVKCIQAIIKNTAEQKWQDLPEAIFKEHYEKIEELKKKLSPKTFEETSEPVVWALLKHEGFQNRLNANKKSGYPNPPFDFFAYRDGEPYMIEYKGSLENFNSPGETQKRRLQELRKKYRPHNLHVALLQVGFQRGKTGEYRLLIDGEMDHLFAGDQVPLDKLEEWIEDQLGISSRAPKPA